MLRQVFLVFSLLTVVAQAWRPVGQLTGTWGSSQVFPAHTELTQFQADGNLKSFTHDNGRLIVQKNGYYYMYAQVFFESTYPNASVDHNQVALAVNGSAVSLTQTGLGEERQDYGSRFTGIVKYLKEGDYISLKTVLPSRLWVSNAHTFFGAYRQLPNVLHRVYLYVSSECFGQSIVLFT